MTQTSIDISTRALSSTGQGTASTKSDKEATCAGQDFGAMMNTLLGEQSAMATPPAQPSSLSSGLGAVGDQDLSMASDIALSADAAAQSLMLRAFQIGPHLQVITPQTAAPEGQSLEMFARSQGLDEAALQWLMGTTSLTLADGMARDMPPGALTSSLPGAVVTDLASIGATPTPSSLLAAQQGLASAAPWSMASSWMAANPLDTPAQGMAGIAPENRAGLLLPAVGDTSPAQGKPGMASQTPAGLLQPASADTFPVQITLIQSDTDHDLKPVAPAGPSVPVTASEWLKSNTLEIHSLKNSLLGKHETPLKLLDLSHLVTPEIQATLDNLNMGGGSMGQDSPAQGHGSFSSRAEPTAMGRTESSAPAASAPEVDSAQRRENIQNLAEKMGQAVGQRILSEIERGQWHLKLSLRPATLGHIEVEMRMRSGEMDAVFIAGQALTRELLNEGMSKLKDTLNQMGMDVASLKVDDGHHRQGGGESTPDRQALVKDNVPSETTETTAPQPVMALTKMGVDGWDVLV